MATPSVRSFDSAHAVLTPRQASKLAASLDSASDLSEDDYMPPEVRTPPAKAATPAAAGVYAPAALRPLSLDSCSDDSTSKALAPVTFEPAHATSRQPAVPQHSVLDLTAHTQLRFVDGTVLSNNAAVRVVRLPASVETIGDDFAAGCPRLRTVDVSRCARLRSVGARFFAGSGAPLAGALALDLSGCGALRSIGAEFAADSEASVIVLPAGLARVGPGFAARPAGGTPLVDVSRCTMAVANAIASQPATGGVGRRVVRYVKPAVRRQSLVGFAVTSLQALVVYFLALAFKLLVAASRLVFGTAFH